MRICVFAFVLIALAQPAFARSHSHHHAQHVADPRMQPAQGISFARTDAIDTAFVSDPAYPARAGNGWNEPATQRSGATRLRVAGARNGALDAMIARHAAANGLPVALVHRVVKRESGYNPRASSRGNLGLMQIRYQTARGVGYAGSAAGLLNPEVNLTYAVKYLAGAYRAAGGNAGRAVSLYASGYHGRGVVVARRAPAAADAWGWQSAPVSMGGNPMRGEFMRTDASRGMI